MPKSVKTERLGRLIERQKAWSHRANTTLVGRDLRVLVKETARDGDYVMGHSDQQHTVLVPKDQVRRLGLHAVRVEQATPHTLYGTVVGADVNAVPLLMAS
jgi:tRNA-2-methylthio-N6-dimethylallyladenosine synthase